MNRRYGLSADATLKAAQALYEAKLITLPADRLALPGQRHEGPRSPASWTSSGPSSRPRSASSTCDALAFTGRIIDDTKVSDHHAIIPTGKRPGALSPAGQKVFDAVVIRLIAAFYPACVKEVTTVAGVSNGVPFRARGVRVLEPGWTALYPRKDDDRKEDEQELPEFRPGESGPHEPSVRRGRDHAAEALHRGDPPRGDGDGREARGRRAAEGGAEGAGPGHAGDAGGDHRDAPRAGLHHAGEEGARRDRPGPLPRGPGPGPGPEEPGADGRVGGEAPGDRARPAGPAPVHGGDRPRTPARSSARGDATSIDDGPARRLPALRPAGHRGEAGVRLLRLAGGLPVRALEGIPGPPARGRPGPRAPAAARPAPAPAFGERARWSSS